MKQELANKYAQGRRTSAFARMMIPQDQMTNYIYELYAAYLAGWNDRDKPIMNIREVEHRQCGNCRHEKEEIDGIICHPCTDQNLWEAK